MSLTPRRSGRLQSTQYTLRRTTGTRKILGWNVYSGRRVILPDRRVEHPCRSSSNTLSNKILRIEPYGVSARYLRAERGSFRVHLIKNSSINRLLICRTSVTIFRREVLRTARVTSTSTGTLLMTKTSYMIRYKSNSRELSRNPRGSRRILWITRSVRLRRIPQML